MGKALVIKGADFSTNKIETIEFLDGKVILTLNTAICAGDEGGGTVTGAGTYDEDTKVAITATPDSGYKFVMWSDGDTNASRTIDVGDEDLSLTALFYDENYELVTWGKNTLSKSGSIRVINRDTVLSTSIPSGSTVKFVTDLITSGAAVNYVGYYNGSNSVATIKTDDYEITTGTEWTKVGIQVTSSATRIEEEVTCYVFKKIE